MITNPAKMGKNGTLLFANAHERFSVVFFHTLYATVLNIDSATTNITTIITILLTSACKVGAFVRGFLFALAKALALRLLKHCRRVTYFILILVSSPVNITSPVHEGVFLIILPR